jgi:hypothetical protein
LGFVEAGVHLPAVVRVPADCCALELVRLPVDEEEAELQRFGEAELPQSCQLTFWAGFASLNGAGSLLPSIEGGECGEKNCGGFGPVRRDGSGALPDPKLREQLR